MLHKSVPPPQSSCNWVVGFIPLKYKVNVLQEIVISPCPIQDKKVSINPFPHYKKLSKSEQMNDAKIAFTLIRSKNG